MSSSGDSKPTRARQSIPSIIGVSKQPDISRITEGESDAHESPQSSPHLYVTHSPSSKASSRPNSVVPPKARDSLSLTWSGTPVASSSSSRRAVRRPSGLIPAFDPIAHSRISPPPNTLPNSEDSNSVNKQTVSNPNEFNPVLSPIAFPIEETNSNTIYRPRERDRVRRKALSSAPEPSEDDLELHGHRLHDVTNASPTSTKKDHKYSSKRDVDDAHISKSSKPPPPPTPIAERRPKKSLLPTPSLSEEFVKHGIQVSLIGEIIVVLNNSPISGDTTALMKGTKSGSTSAVQNLVPPMRNGQTGRSLSPAELSAKSDAETASAEEGRERRVRKSVNYAEPKLNTYASFI